jgi:hypothetical protein
MVDIKPKPKCPIAHEENPLTSACIIMLHLFLEEKNKIEFLSRRCFDVIGPD